MSQVKYIIYACLILLVSFAAITVLSTLSGTTFIAESTSFIESDEPSEGKIELSYGQKLFRDNCAPCHSMDKVLSGPALRGVTERGPWEKEENLKKWIRNPARFITGNKYAKTLQKEYNLIMPSFTNFTDGELNAIIEYLKGTQIQY